MRTGPASILKRKMSRVHRPKKGVCKKCERLKYLIWFRDGYVCEDCLNPPIDDAAENYLNRSSALGEAENQSLGMIGTTRGKTYVPSKGWRIIVKDGKEVRECHDD